MEHEVSYERNRKDGRWRAFCKTCCWCMVGAEQEVKERAQTHDEEWVTVEYKTCA